MAFPEPNVLVDCPVGLRPLCGRFSVKVQKISDNITSNCHGERKISNEVSSVSGPNFTEHLTSILSSEDSSATGCDSEDREKPSEDAMLREILNRPRWLQKYSAEFFLLDNSLANFPPRLRGYK